MNTDKRDEMGYLDNLVTLLLIKTGSDHDKSSQAPVDFILEGASTEKFPDNESKWWNKWEIIDAQKNQKWTDVLTQTYKIKQPDSFLHYRIRILATEGKYHASIAEWELIK